MKKINLGELLRTLHTLDFSACSTSDLLNVAVLVGVCQNVLNSDSLTQKFGSTFVQELSDYNARIRKEVAARDAVFMRLQKAISRDPRFLVQIVSSLPFDELLKMYDELEDKSTDPVWASFRQFVGDMIAAHSSNSSKC